MNVTKKNMVYVGGLVSQVNEEILHAAFIPFGEIKAVQIPKDFALDKGRGFGFVEFEFDDDCAAAIENMDGAELYGKVIRCNLAKPMTTIEKGKGVWSAEEWLSEQQNVDADQGDEEGGQSR